jgi:hypothetical protein
MTSEGARKDHFCNFCKKRRREKIAENFKGYHSKKITKLVFQQLVTIGIETIGINSQLIFL